ncbi:hypothetical protein D3C73_1518500 [compost metagenome]
MNLEEMCDILERGDSVICEELQKANELMRYYNSIKGCCIVEELDNGQYSVHE